MTSLTRTSVPRTALVYAMLMVISLIIVLPLLWMLLTSFKTDFDAISNPASPFPDPFTLDAYDTLSTGQYPIFRWFANSLIAATAQTALILVTASTAAYALARLEFSGKKIVFGLIVGTLLVPGVIFLIPNYLIVQNFGWLDSLLAIIVPGSSPGKVDFKMIPESKRSLLVAKAP